MNFENIAYWHWWVAGLVFLILETFVPGTVFLWFGASAGVVGLLALLLPGLSWQLQFVIFGVVAVIAFFAWRRFKPDRTAEDQPTLNRRGHSYVGRQFTLSEPIINGVGMLRVDDSQWRIHGDDAPAGTQVRVVAVEGANLRVERAG